MANVKVKVLLPFVSKEKSFGHGDEITIDQDLAYKFSLKNVVEFLDKKQFEKIDKDIKEKEKAKEDAELQKEKELAALLEKESLEAERENLQKRVDAITDILGDSKTYNK